MHITARVAAGCVAATLATGSLAAPALAAGSSTHWSHAKCQSWRSAFVKRNPHASKTRKAEGNRVLSGKGCSQRIK